MKNRILRGLAAVGLTLLAASTAFAQPAGSITVKVNQPGIKVSPTLYGIFFEEINRAGDGGLYGEMLQNRSFEDCRLPVGWTLLKGDGDDGAMALDKSQPLNESNPTSLKLTIAKGRVGIVSQGFKGMRYNPRETNPEFLRRFDDAAKKSTAGIAVEQGKEYRVSLHARCGDGFSGPITVELQKQDGTVLAKQEIAGIEAGWKKFQATLSPSATDRDVKLVVSAAGKGTLWLDMVSMFPKDTFKGHENGLRKDIAQAIADMKPAFVRFPGGCYVEGDRLENAFRWKKTIGDVAQRPGHWNLWGYMSNDGLGYHEYLQFCEDIGAEPLYVINCGMSHEEQRSAEKGRAMPKNVVDEYVQDALDCIEYANGPADSKWGAMRAKNGHPAPFNMKFMEIGNENGGPVYHERYGLFHDAIKKKYPEMRLIANVWSGIPGNRPIEIVDEHYYNTPEFFMSRANMYDKYDRSRFKVYVGEYAVTRNAGTGNLIAAIGEAAYMTGLERNGDVVVMASYAPLLVSPTWKGWNPNAIVFDAGRVYGTPSYHVQAMFGNHRADVVVPTEARSDETVAGGRPGMIGLATWATQAEFKDVKVVDKEGKVLLESDFTKGMKGWRVVDGDWQIKDGALRQSDRGNGVRVMAGDRNWSDYTLTLKARKTGGAEGFLIIFQSQNPREKSWWNIGGWGNRRHAIEADGISDDSVDGKIETGKWYDIKVECAGPRVRCYLDGKLIHDLTRQGHRSLYAVAGLSADGREAIVKVVNTSAKPTETQITLEGAQVEPRVKALVLAGAGPDEENSFEAPRNIAPREETISGASGSFKHTFPGLSVTIMRLQLKK